MEHAVLAPSSAHRWGRCAGSIKLARDLPPEEETDAAREGTLAASVAAKRILTGEWPAEATVDHRLLLQDYVDLAASLNTSGTEQLIETKMSCSLIHDECSGTPDGLWINREQRKITVADLKWGYGEVKAVKNYQGVAYLAAGAEVAGLGFAEGPDWTYEFIVVQPRLWHREGPIRRWRPTLADFWGLVALLGRQARAALGSWPPTVVGAWCDHCPARHVCSTLRDATMADVDDSHRAEPLDLPADTIGRELALLRAARDRIDARLSGVEADVEARLRGGARVPGWQIEYPPGREKWTVPAAQIITLGELMGINLAQPLDCLTPAQARKAGVPAEAIENMRERLSGKAKLRAVTEDDLTAAFGTPPQSN